MTFKRVKWCVDCNREDPDCNWCDICTKMVCIDCDDLHDCLANEMDPEELADLDAANAEEKAVDENARLFSTPKKVPEGD